MSKPSRRKRPPAKGARRQGAGRSKADRGTDEATALRERVASLERELLEERTRAAESLDRQAATAEILRIISSSRGTSQPVLDAVARSAD